MKKIELESRLKLSSSDKALIKKKRKDFEFVLISRSVEGDKVETFANDIPSGGNDIPGEEWYELRGLRLEASVEIESILNEILSGESVRDAVLASEDKKKFIAKGYRKVFQQQMKEKKVKPLDTGDLPLELYSYEDTDKSGKPIYIFVGFYANQSKPMWNNAYFSKRQRDDDIQMEIDRVEREQAKRKADAEAQIEVDVGDFFYSSWGYDQTNIDFYEVIDIKNKTATVRQVAKKVIKSSPDYGSELVMPQKGEYIGSPMRKLIKSFSGDLMFKVNSYSSAFKWDGKPKSQTDAYSGH